MNHKKLQLFLGILTICLITVSCADFKKAAQKTNTTNEAVETTTIAVNETPNPTFSGTLKLTCRNPLTLNPLLNEDRSVDQLLKLVFEPIYTIDATNKPQPNLIETAIYNGTDATMTLTLKPNLVFHNGEALAADDVKFSIETLMDAPATALYKSCVKNVSKIVLTDELNLTIYYHTAYAFAAYDLNFPIVPKDYTQSETYDALKPVGSGLYAFVDFTAMKSIHLSAFEGRKSEVYVQNIDCTITRDDSVEETAFQQNLVDVYAPAKFDWFNHSDDNTQKTFIYTSNYFEFIGFNFNNALLSNINIRKAIAHGINRDALSEKTYLSHAVITDSLLHPNSYLNPEDVPLTYTYDPAIATTQLQAIPLFDNDADGFYDLTSNTVITKLVFKLLVNVDNAARIKVATLIQNDLADIGLFIEIDAVDRVTFQSKLLSGAYDLVLTDLKLSDVPDFTQLFHTQNEGNPGLNFIHYKNPLMDKALETTYASPSEEVLKINLQKFNEMYATDLPYFSLYFLDAMILTNSNVNGQFRPTTTHVYNGIENIYLSK